MISNLMYICTPILKGGKEIYVDGAVKHLYAQRVLTPTEYVAIYEASQKWENQVRLDLCLLTAGRYAELREFQVNKQWFEIDHNALHVKEHKNQRLKRGIKDRYIHLSRKGVDMVKVFVNSKFILSNYTTMQANLIRWAQRANVSTEGLSIKCMRKTYESWLIASYPDKTLAILQSTGHTQAVSMEHYANLPFTQKDLELMKPYVEGWM